MTREDFIFACNTYNIDPSIALESEAVLDVIANGSLDDLYEVLENEC